MTHRRGGVAQTEQLRSAIAELGRLRAAKARRKLTLDERQRMTLLAQMVRRGTRHRKKR